MKNVYAELGTCFANTAVTHPRLAAAMLGTLIKGRRVRQGPLGHRLGVVRLAAVADRGAAPARDPGRHAEEARLRAARRRPTAPVKNAIFAGNAARLYGIDPATVQGEIRDDHIAAMRRQFLAQGTERSNLRYGYVAKAPAR